MMTADPHDTLRPADPGRKSFDLPDAVNVEVRTKTSSLSSVF